jgi:hypothetical protein
MLEPFLLLPRRWEEGGLVGGCRVVVDSFGTTLCPCRGFSVRCCRITELIPKVVEHLPVLEDFVQKITPGCREPRSRPAALA